MKYLKKYITNNLLYFNKIPKSIKLHKKRHKINSFKLKEYRHIDMLEPILEKKELETELDCYIKGPNKIVEKSPIEYSSVYSPKSGHKWCIESLDSTINDSKSVKDDIILKQNCIAFKLAQKVLNKVKLTQKGSSRKDKPKKNKNGELIFSDIIYKYPEFKPNLSPEEIFRSGSFGGTYFRPIYSKVLSKKLKNQHNEYNKYGWFKNMEINNYIISNNCNKNINKYNVKAGSSLKLWEDSGWIKPIDPYGWFQWYCRFYVGRRCSDDDRQIKRWINYAGKTKGRWRRRLINMCKKSNKKFDDNSISPVIRQGLQHWAYVITKDDLK